jgi:hypothetical protein
VIKLTAVSVKDKNELDVLGREKRRRKRQRVR